MRRWARARRGRKKTADLREKRSAVNVTVFPASLCAGTPCHSLSSHEETVGLVHGSSILTSGSSSGRAFPSRVTGQWQTPTVVAGHSGGSVTDSHRLPSTANDQMHHIRQELVQVKQKIWAGRDHRHNYLRRNGFGLGIFPGGALDRRGKTPRHEAEACPPKFRARSATLRVNSVEGAGAREEPEKPTSLAGC